LTAQHEKISSFFDRNIPNLGVPVVDKKPNRVSVGPYRVITNGTEFELWQGRTLIKTFRKRSWATAYALCLYNGNRSAAGDLTAVDTQYSKLTEDRDQYRYCIKLSRERNNVEREIIMENRLSRVESEIHGLEQRGETILKSLHFS
jgi:hypothetical protein